MPRNKSRSRQCLEIASQLNSLTALSPGGVCDQTAFITVFTAALPVCQYEAAAMFNFVAGLGGNPSILSNQDTDVWYNAAVASQGGKGKEFLTAGYDPSKKCVSLCKLLLNYVARY